MADETVDWERNEFVVRGEAPDGFTYYNIVIDLNPFPWEDDTFRGYRFTPFPKLYAAERKVRHLATEGRERVTGAWKVLRGDRDPFDMGDEW